MSGICGEISKDRSRKITPEVIGRMLEFLNNRGGEQRETYLQNEVGLGICGWSFLKKEQLFFNKGNNLVLICDGEIYNAGEFKTELESKGYRLKGSSDLEIMALLYEEKGIDFLESLRGIFSLALWDGVKKQLYLVRDRLGLKPLYFSEFPGSLIFASLPGAVVSHPEVKKELDLASLDCYLTFEYVMGSSCIFKGVKKLLPGHYLLFKDGRIEIKPYWEINFSIIPGRKEETLVREILRTFRESIKLRLLSDTDTGVLLSGGFDSSAIVALMSKMVNPVKTFSIGFEDKSYNELKYARIVSKTFKTEHHELIVSSQKTELIRQILGFFDEPLADTSIFPTFLAFKLAREHVKTVLCGDGGDESFGGYDTYIAQGLTRYAGLMPPFIKRYFAGIKPEERKKGLINRFRRFFQGEILPSDLKHTRWMIAFSHLDKKYLYKDSLFRASGGVDSYDLIRSLFKQAGNLPELCQLEYVDLHSYLPDAGLVKVDRLSSVNSIQARFPFLDKKVVELMATVPLQMKLKGFKTKYITKEAMKDILPSEIINKAKEGFSSPVKNWMRKELKELLLELLSPGQLKKRGLFNESYVQTLIKNHLAGKEDNSHRLWSLLVFEIWAQKWLDRK